jgi:hypothetical protein
MENKRLGLIVPWRGDYQDLHKFLGHIEYFLNNKEIHYKFYIIEQVDKKPFNYGALCNTGYELAKDECDYFIFHSPYFIPVDDTCDYSYSTKVQHLSSVVDAFGYKKPYAEWIGGAIKFTHETFEEVNGYSDEYWGIGMEDVDMLYRLNRKKLVRNKKYFNIDMLKEHDLFDINEISNLKKVSLTYFDFDKKYKSCMIKSTKNTKYVFQDSFTIDMFLYVDRNKNYDSFIFGKQGYNAGIFFKDNKALNLQLWNSDGKVCEVWYENFNLLERWMKITMKFDFDAQHLWLYVDGLPVASNSFNGEVFDYTDKDIWIGSLAFNHQFSGKVSNILVFDYALSDSEILNLYKQNYINETGNIVTREKAIIDIPFSKKYKDFYIDMGLYESHVRDLSATKEDNTKTELISLNYDYNFPEETPGKYKCLDVDRMNDFKNIWRWSGNVDLEENKHIFFNDVLPSKTYFKKVGLSSLEFKKENEFYPKGEDGMDRKNVEIYQIKL